MRTFQVTKADNSCVDIEADEYDVTNNGDLLFYVRDEYGALKLKWGVAKGRWQEILPYSK